MTSDPNSTNVNVPPPPRRAWPAPLVAAALALLALVGLVAVLILGPRESAPSALGSPSPSPSPTVAATATATPAATPTATATASPNIGMGRGSPTGTAGAPARTHESPLGYSVVLPEGWRRSEILSHTAPIQNGDPENLASDVFTIRSPEDERAAREASVNMTGPGPVNSYTAWVRIYRNSEGQTTREFAEDQSHGFGLQVESVEDITLADRGGTSGGRPATRITWRWPVGGTSFATYVEDDQKRMWAIGFYLAMDEREAPSGATRDDLVEIVSSFSAPWLRN